VGRNRQKKRGGGAERFYEFFQDIFGERWETLLEELEKGSNKVARHNIFFSDKEKIAKYLTDTSYGVAESNFKIEALKQCFLANENFRYEKFGESLWPFYRMDPASIFAPFCLGVQSGHHVLDMCAAPGGKSLVLIESLGDEGTIVLNEYSAKRKYRLMSVVKNYVPLEMRQRIEITGQDGARFRSEPEQFHRILIDAPCSGERELLHKPLDLDLWKPSRSKKFALKQYALLAAGVTALKVEGLLVYSTCSLSPFENDGVIQKLLDRRGDEVQIVPLKFSIGEATKHGWHFLPDQSHGWGPIYMCLIRKVS